MSNGWPTFIEPNSSHSVRSLADISPQALGELQQFMQQRFALQQASGLLAPTKIAPNWQSYTPTWAASAGTPSIGNGTLTGRFIVIGKTVHCHVNFVAGSTTTFGTAGAFWTFTLPVTSASGLSGGAGYAENLSVASYPVIVRHYTTTQIILHDSAGGATVGGTTPFSWGTGDYFDVGITYESA